MGKAICIGINKYPDVFSHLHGCVNDAKDWAAFLRKRGFDVMPPILDAAATKRTMVGAMMSLVEALQPQETGVITFSGHGTWMPDMNGDEPDKRDEALCPYDVSGTCLLLDDEIQQILQSRTPGSRVVLVTDSCHSATAFRMVGRPGSGMRPRFVPPDAFVEDAKTRRQINRVRASKTPTSTMKRSNAPVAGIVHFGGCNDKSYSYDAMFGKRPNGAFTYWALRALLSYPRMRTYEAFFKDVLKRLPSEDYPQTPHLNATTADKAREAFAQ